MNVAVSAVENGKRTMVADSEMYNVIVEALRFTMRGYDERAKKAGDAYTATDHKQDLLFQRAAESIITACHEASKVNDGHTSG